MTTDYRRKSPGEIGRVGQPFPLGGCRRNKVGFMPRQNFAQADGLLICRARRRVAEGVGRQSLRSFLEISALIRDARLRREAC